jgi:hypothetical protein
MAVGPQPSPNFLRRITERRIPQIIIGYLVAAWLALQVVGFFVEHEMMSGVALRLVLVLVATALPAVVMGAWFHGRRGRQKFEPIEYWVFGALGVIWLVTSVVILFTWPG